MTEDHLEMVQFLLEQAHKLRLLAASIDGAISQNLLVLARALEARAEDPNEDC